MGRTANRFTKGSAVYECRCCGYRTRDTGRGDNEMVQLCADCYDLSGEENHLSDNGKLYDNPQNVLVMIERVQLRTGRTALWNDLRDQAFKQLGINPATPKAARTAAQVSAIEATAQRLLADFNKFGATIQSKANRKFFFDIVDNARINANDTVYTERASEDWEAIFRGTIESELCSFGSQFQGTIGQLNLTVKHLRAYFEKLSK